MLDNIKQGGLNRKAKKTKAAHATGTAFKSAYTNAQNCSTKKKGGAV